jgi:membrane-bound metal-dependent hydrolase YbcI (DUF457 family)
MFAIGHFALGYLTGKGSSKLIKTKFNLPLLLVASVIPDVDLLLQLQFPYLMHRGPTHSILTLTVLMIPFFIIYRKKAVPYYAALLSHSLIGDFFTGGIMLFWPLSRDFFSCGNLDVTSLPSVIAEIVLFALTLVLMFKTKELQSLLKPSKNNRVLFVAFVAVLGPLLRIGRNGVQESSLPILLIVPSLFWLCIFACSMLVGLSVWRKAKNDGTVKRAA